MNAAQKLLLGTSVALLAASSHAADGESNLKAIAEGWVMANCGDRDGFVDYVEANMADDGMWMRERYVGLGFTIPNDALTVQDVMSGTPAAEVLKPGDTFVSVNGMEATDENRDRLNFRGKPGEPVSAVVLRDGEEVAVEIQRGLIEQTMNKETALNGLRVGDGEGWGTGTCTIEETIREGSVVYVHTAWTDVEQDTGIDFKGSSITRLQFNDEGKVLEGWERQEERFILEQLGYTISR